MQILLTLKPRARFTVGLCLLIAGIEAGAGEGGGEMEPGPQPTSIVRSAVKVRELTFQLSVDRTWSVPAKHDVEGSAVELNVQISNLSQAAVHLFTLDTLRFALTASDGHALLFDGGRNALRAGAATVRALSPTDCVVLSRVARLVWIEEGQKLRLVGGDEFGSVWYFDGLGPGTFRLQAVYENERPRIGEGVPLWTGKAVTPELEISVQQKGGGERTTDEPM